MAKPSDRPITGKKIGYPTPGSLDSRVVKNNPRVALQWHGEGQGSPLLVKVIARIILLKPISPFLKIPHHSPDRSTTRKLIAVRCHHAHSIGPYTHLRSV